MLGLLLILLASSAGPLLISTCQTLAPLAAPDKGPAGRASRRWKGGGAGALLVILAALGPLGAAQAQVPPNERWRSLETEHFRVTFPEGLDSLARVAAARAEVAYAALAEAFVAAPGGRTEVLLTDHVDVSNGLATVTPYRRMTIYARPPIDGFALSHFDDWFELVITHELAHVFHLEAGGGVARLLRSLFGRVPTGWPFFPQYTSPRWVVEGIATYYESALTESGRVRGTQQEMVLRAAALAGRFEDIGQASGQSAVWPAGSRPYIYGSFFFDHLLRRYGEERMAAFVEAVAGQWIPYRLNAASRRAFGVSFSQAWEAWRAEAIAEARTFALDRSHPRPLTEPELLTSDARQALYPQVSPDGSTLAFARFDGRSDAQLTRTAVEGGRPERLMRTNGLAAFSWLPGGGLLFSQFQLDGTYEMRGDLHVRAADGRIRRLTHGARLDHPAAAPDGLTAVAVQTAPGSTSLVEVDLATGAVTPLVKEEPTSLWAFPRVSPDGRWIAASRWLPGAYFDVVVVDRTGRVVAEVTRDRALDVAPSWSADGRWLVWGSDRTGVPNLMAAPFDPATGQAGPVRQATNLLTGGLFPSLDPSGTWVYFSHYDTEGWDVARVPFEPDAWPEAPEQAERFVAQAPTGLPPVLPEVESRPYAPLRTLYPRFWEPQAREPITASGREIMGLGIGLRTLGQDLVGRHAFDLRAVLATSGGELDGALAYRYQGLGRVHLSVSAEQAWDAAGPLFGERSEDTVDTLWVTERERRASAAATLRLPGFRAAASLTLGAGLVQERLNLLDQRLEPESVFRLERPDASLTDLRASVNVSSARSHGLSIGLEQGVSGLVQARRRVHLALPDTLRGVSRFDRGFDELLVRLQAYHAVPGPGFSNHVLAARATAGWSGGPGAGASHFRVGGASGFREPLTGLGLFGGSAEFFPVRGYGSGGRRGRYAWSVTGEYRVPLALLNQGLGLFPVHLDRASASLFVDSGSAWGGQAPGTPREGPLASVGLEVLADLLALYSVPLTVRAGLAFPLVERAGAQLYLRFGRSF